MISIQKNKKIIFLILFLSFFLEGCEKKTEDNSLTSLKNKILNNSLPFCKKEITSFDQTFTKEALYFLNPIPDQVPISSEKYSQYREKAASEVDLEKSLCAKFVNKLFLARFGQEIYGNAWDMQLKEENQKFLKLVYRLDENKFLREKNLELSNSTNRSKIYKEIYEILDREKMPIGVLGFLYRYSPERENLAKNKKVLPQSHVGFLAGKKEFYFQNTSQNPKLLREIISEKYGEIRDFEENFLASRIPLEKILKSNEKYIYQDYLIEEHFKGIKAGSLLEIFLRKHRNNRKTPLLRPVSYSRISKELYFLLTQKISGGKN